MSDEGTKSDQQRAPDLRGGTFEMLVREAIQDLDAAGFPGGFSADDNPTFESVVQRIVEAAARDAVTPPTASSESDAHEVDPLSVECSYCGAKPGKPCHLRRRDGGEACMPHTTRYEAAKRRVTPTGRADQDRWGDAEALARQFHETYERLAPAFHYETRRESAKPWEEVPDTNRKLMVAVCAEILEGLRTKPAGRGTERAPSSEGGE